MIQMMLINDNIYDFHLKSQREFLFTPRIINPVRVSNAVIFSADEQIRQTKKVINEKMPWIKVDVLSDPVSASNYKSEKLSVFLFDDTAMTFVDTEKICRNNQDVVLVLLSSNPFVQCSPHSIAEERYPYTTKTDLIFAVNKTEFVPDQIITAVLRCAEDKLNIEKYSRERRFIFLIVDDEPRWFSQFLPVLYNIIGQRADVMITRTYEETLEFLFGVDADSKINDEEYLSCGHGDDVVCLITDIFFPKGKDLSGDAGRALVKLMNRYYPRIPIIVASKAELADDLRNIAYIMPKGDPGSLQTLSDYIHDFTGMGNFIIRSKTEDEYHRIRNIRELYEILLKAEKETKSGQRLRELLEYYGKIDYFSTWLYMHGFRELGDQIRPRHDRGRRLVTVLRRYLKREILRMNFTPLIIDGNKIFTLQSLLHLLRTIDPIKIQWFTDNDVFSTWLDRKGYAELAEELRPIHGRGARFEKTLADLVEKWINIYQERIKY